MSLHTNGINVEQSFNLLVQTYVSEIQTALNAQLGSSYVIPVFFDQPAEVFPSVQVRFFAAGGQSAARHRKVDRLQIDVRTQDEQSPIRKKIVNRLIRDSLTDKLGLTTRRASFHAYFPVKDFFENKLAATRKQNARLELFSQSGWAEVPDEDPTVLRWLIDFEIFYK